MSELRQLPEPLDRLRADLVAAAEREAPVPRRRRRGRAWLAGIAAATGLVFAGSAGAVYVLQRPTTEALDQRASADAPAIKALAPNLDRLRTVGPQPPSEFLAGQTGEVLGLTVERSGLTVDVVFDDKTICTSSRTPGGPEGSVSCGLRSASDAAPQLELPQADGSSWLMAVLPDGSSNLRAFAKDGTVASGSVTGNIAIARLPGTVDIESFTWTAADGTPRAYEIRFGPEP